MTEIRLLVPLACLTGLFPIATNLPPPTLLAGADGRCPPSRGQLTIVAPTPSVVIAVIVVAGAIGAGRRVLETFKRMEHEGESRF